MAQKVIMETWESNVCLLRVADKALKLASWWGIKYAMAHKENSGKENRQMTLSHHDKEQVILWLLLISCALNKHMKGFE